jgi:hypothetical protein
MTPEVVVSYESIKIRFGGILHVHLQRPIFAVQSWVQERQVKYTIQYTTAGGDVTSEYDDREKWASILTALDKIL